MAKNLVIVESPAKAKTIEKFLGPDYTVKSSFGHIRDLAKKDKNNKTPLIVEGVTTDFDPLYEVSPDKTKVVRELKAAAKGKEVWLAADEDREGEAIAWHVCEALNLDPAKTKRIVFHEITKKAITTAIKEPRTVNNDLVDAQQARRVLDRLVGFKLSPVLWQKIAPKLSAGRVQSVAVRLIVEREEEIRGFESGSFFRISAEFISGDESFAADVSTKLKTAFSMKKFQSREEAESFLKELIGNTFTVEEIAKKEGKKNPSAPFTTSTLQQAASTRLGFSVKRTMMAAQRLYEAGKITYMRTDSVNLSNDAIASAANEIKKNFGEDYLEVRKFKTKSAGAQEAHEAIRPTDFATTTAGKESDQTKLYELIWKRAMASQMKPARVDKTEIIVSAQGVEDKFVATGEVIAFDGFLKVYPENSKDVFLPNVQEGEILDYKQIVAQENYTKPPSRYTEASLVKKLETEGIGRPSTYAPTISTIQDRGYIEKSEISAKQRDVVCLTLAKGEITEEAKSENYGACKGKLIPTGIGETVNKFLVEHFTEILDYQFTAKIEKEFDVIAHGELAWKKMIKEFYGSFEKLVVAAGGLDRNEVLSVRELGIDPKSNKPVFARVGRFGPMIQIGTKDDEEKPQFASIPSGQSLETIELAEALKLFDKAAKNILGQTPEGDEVELLNGRFGWYLKIGKTNVSLKRDRKDRSTGEIIPGDNPDEMTLERALELYEEKKIADANKYIQVWEKEKIQLLRGPYGIYIKADKKNVKIPKTVENPEKLTLEECQDIIKNSAPTKGKKAPAKKAAPKKKTAAKKK